MSSMVFQPTASARVSKFQALNALVSVYDMALNVYLGGKGNSNKLSFGYQIRPIVDQVSLKSKEYKGMALFQYQVFIK